MFTAGSFIQKNWERTWKIVKMMTHAMAYYLSFRKRKVLFFIKGTESIYDIIE